MITLWIFIILIIDLFYCKRIELLIITGRGTRK